ncbi:MAG: cation-translocating P-type ATPase [Nanoarchaeota archaeon]|nr:cation-translocating P-type ATPase [Nanoarchaeota archaeon]
MHYHDKSVKEVLDLTATHENGLTNEEATQRLQEFGPNELEHGKKDSPIKIFFRQFNDVLVYILLFAAIVAIVAREFIDAYVIGGILIFNAVFGFIQEYKAEKAIDLLKKLTTLSTNVLRDGKIQKIQSMDLVKGDIVVLESGDKVPADLRIIKQSNLQSDESTLTGESNPITKTEKPIASSAQLADRKNILYSGTSIVRGVAKAVVVSTGMSTEIGKIAKLVQEAEHQETPLQKKLKEFGRFLGYLIGIVCLLVFVIGMIRGMDIIEILLTSIALAVAAVPEGLPAIVTICLALGVQRMVKRNALIRRLESIETLGCITVICSDKTGTMTKNEMTVTSCYANENFYQVTGKGYNDLGEYIDHDNKKINPQLEFSRLLEAMMSCNNATETIGDPTERALYFAGLKGKSSRITRKGEIPFDSDQKYMATLHNGFDYYKGAPEIILKMCTHIQINNKVRRILPKDTEKILGANKNMAMSALRVLAAAYKQNDDIIFLGLMGMIDPPKEGVKEALMICQTAGITPVMITGDHPITAKAIADKINLKGSVITGSELENIDDSRLKSIIINHSIYARMTSPQKVRILKAYQDNGEIVAMTGDGVNDAPAIKNANVGVAMSQKGTDIARDASDMVLVDDHFSSIVSSIEEGRIIYDNIKKFIKYLLAANMIEIGVVLVAMLAGLPLPLLPLQILWVNLMTDSWPALALGVDPPDKNIMKRRPRSANDNIIKEMFPYIIIVGIIGTIAVLGLFIFAINTGVSIEKSRTIALSTLIILELMIVHSVKNPRPFKDMFNNEWLNGAVLLSLILHMIVVYTPLNKLFKLAPLTVADWIPIIIVSAIGFLCLETFKYLKIKNSSKLIEN